MVPPQLLEQLERLERLLFNSALQKPSASYAVVVDPEEITAAGFGEIVFAVDLAVPPAAGENIRPNKFVDGSVFWSQKEPAVFMRRMRRAGGQNRLGCNPAH